MEDKDGLVRLSKLLSQRGVVSRRGAEALMEEGRVKVNGEPATEPGTKVDPDHDDIRVDNKRLPPAPQLVYFLMYKPRGYLTTRNDPEGRPTIFDLAEGLQGKVEPVGRLDFDTEGALLLTNDGTLAHKLSHPSTKVPKRYMAKVWRTPDERTVRRLERGVKLDDGQTEPARVRIVDGTDTGNAWLEITVTEGRNRLIRRMLAEVRHPVSKLRRVSFATISLRGMERGDVRPLQPDEIERLKEISDGVRADRAGRFRYKKGFARPKPKKKRHGTHKSRRR